MFLAQLAVVFVGVVGPHHEVVAHQLAPTLEKTGLVEVSIPGPELAAVIKHTKASRAVVKKMHVGGLVAVQLAGSGHSRTFRVVIYNADGILSSETESPLSARGLSKADLQVFAINVADATGARPVVEAQRGRERRRRRAAVELARRRRRSAGAAGGTGDPRSAPRPRLRPPTTRPPTRRPRRRSSRPHRGTASAASMSRSASRSAWSVACSRPIRGP